MLSLNTSECSAVGESSISTALPYHERLSNFLEEGAERTKSLWMDGRSAVKHCHLDTVWLLHEVAARAWVRKGTKDPPQTEELLTADGC